MRLLFLSGLAWSLVAASALAQPITYDVGTVYLYDQSDPTHALDYVLRGTITTNGTIGRLNDSDFISWSLQVDGPIPFHFHPGNPNAGVGPSFASATLDALSIRGQFGSLVIHTQETPGCSDCSKRVMWGSWGGGDVSYQNYGDNQVLFTNSGFISGDHFVFATRVPEPLGFSLAILGTAILGALVRVKPIPTKLNPTNVAGTGIVRYRGRRHSCSPRGILVLDLSFSSGERHASDGFNHADLVVHCYQHFG